MEPAPCAIPKTVAQVLDVVENLIPHDGYLWIHLPPRLCISEENRARLLKELRLKFMLIETGIEEPDIVTALLCQILEHSW